MKECPQKTIILIRYLEHDPNFQHFHRHVTPFHSTLPHHSYPSPPTKVFLVLFQELSNFSGIFSLSHNLTAITIYHPSYLTGQELLRWECKTNFSKIDIVKIEQRNPQDCNKELCSSWRRYSPARTASYAWGTYIERKSVKPRSIGCKSMEWADNMNSRKKSLYSTPRPWSWAEKCFLKVHLIIMRQLENSWLLQECPRDDDRNTSDLRGTVPW